MRKTFLRSRRVVSLGLAVALAGLSSGAWAFQEVATGLIVEPPAPLTAEKISNINFAGAVGIKSPEGSPQPAAGSIYLCQVGFAPRPAEGTQDEINAATLDPQALAAIEISLSAEFSSHEAATFTANGVAGFEFFITPKDQPDNRVYTTLLQTPAGVVQQHCTTTAADAEAALVLFRAIRDTVVPP
ncbi:MAG TPA: hypothetical protein VFK32_09280 [Tepidiformaceae bacterium]|nr:hypothetical protein [Tepidiformaceae bacterium]